MRYILSCLDMKRMLWTISLMAITLVELATGQQANCDYSQNIAVGRTYTITSPNYPYSYGANRQCRWVAYCPTGYNCRVQCPEINMPQTASCNGDRLLVSRSGDLQLTGADKYCGVGTLTATSTGQRLTMGLISTSSSRGGRFQCSITAVSAKPPPSGCSCGYKKTNRIVGGVETGVNEYPMMAGLIDTRINEVYCGGVIIYSHYILTAAHCVTNIAKSYIRIVVGEHNVAVGGESPATQILIPADILYHNGYNPNTYDYDIALIMTKTEIQFSDRVGPACLPFKFTNTDFTGRKITALGWGTLAPGAPTSPTLQKVDLDIISQQSCMRSYSTLTNRQLCTFTRGKDTCQYDSGGPCLFLDPVTNLLFSIGVVSNGQSCASSYPGVNTRVTEMMNWITSNTPDAKYCRK